MRNLVTVNAVKLKLSTGTIKVTNPNFSAAGLADNGGLTRTIALTSAIAGKSGTGMTTDQRGLRAFRDAEHRSVRVWGGVPAGHHRRQPEQRSGRERNDDHDHGHGLTGATAVKVGGKAATS